MFILCYVVSYWFPVAAGTMKNDASIKGKICFYFFGKNATAKKCQLGTCVKGGLFDVFNIIIMPSAKSSAKIG